LPNVKDAWSNARSKCRKDFWNRKAV
jgi:hypothetical protein